jgi:hypothetical protein
VNIIDSLKNSNLRLKLSEKKYNVTYKKTDPRMIKAMADFHNCKEKKSSSQIKYEINLAKEYWGCFPLFYYRYGLYKSEMQLTKEQLLNYIPEYFFYSLYLPYYDTNKYAVIIEEKNITEQMFRSLDIKQPHTICKLINKNIYTKDSKPINDFSLIKKVLEQYNWSKIFVKPVDGKGGYGIIIFKRVGEIYQTEDGLEFSEDYLIKLSTKNNYIIQAGIKQSIELDEIYPHSINTFRIATENINGNVRVVCATLRIGKDGKEIDNSSQDGLVLGIDIDTGKSLNYAITEAGRKYYKHPDTGFSFNEFEIKKWDLIKDFAIRSATKMSQFGYLGWDIAVDETGPLAVETNLGFGLDHYQVPLGGLRRHFNIEDPEMYWKNFRR